MGQWTRPLEQVQGTLFFLWTDPDKVLAYLGGPALVFPLVLGLRWSRLRLGWQVLAGLLGALACAALVAWVSGVGLGGGETRTFLSVGTLIGVSLPLILAATERLEVRWGGSSPAEASLDEASPGEPSPDEASPAEPSPDPPGEDVAGGGG